MDPPGISDWVFAPDPWAPPPSMPTPLAGGTPFSALTEAVIDCQQTDIPVGGLSWTFVRRPLDAAIWPILRRWALPARRVRAGSGRSPHTRGTSARAAPPRVWM